LRQTEREGCDLSIGIQVTMMNAVDRGCPGGRITRRPFLPKRCKK